MSAPQDQDVPTDHSWVRPALSFEAITFSDKTILTFDDDEIIVFVGPNNAGKSATLRELENWVRQSQSQVVVRDAKLRKNGTIDDLTNYLERNSQKTIQSNGTTYSGIGYSIHSTHLQYFDNPSARHSLSSFFCTRLSTESRITSSNPAGAIALYYQPPTHPIHLLLMDDKLADDVSGKFKHAFGKDLTVFRAGGSSYPLLIGKKPEKLPGTDELSKSYVDALQSSSVTLETQGDGMRSFVSVLLYVLSADNHSIQFLDEPEAFLHPPQARLIGEYIAKFRKGASQLFIATHSADILEGLIEGGANKVRVIRLQRSGDVNKINELAKDKVSEISRDTLSRYAGVFNGIFYNHVVICESDSDCLFYNSFLMSSSGSGDQRPDVLFLHASGKARMGKIAETLRSLGVPISVVADIDILNDKATFESLITKLGGVWTDFESHWVAIKNAVEQAKPPLNAAQIVGMIEKELSSVGGMDKFPKDRERNIKNIFKSLSPWQELKQNGRSALRGSQVIQHYDQLYTKCSALGLWIVPVGELEGFCRSIEASHGPAFVERVLEERDLETDPELRDVREFVGKIWLRARTTA